MWDGVGGLPAGIHKNHRIFAGRLRLCQIS